MCTSHDPPWAAGHWCCPWQPPAKATLAKARPRLVRDLVANSNSARRAATPSGTAAAPSNYLNAASEARAAACGGLVAASTEWTGRHDQAVQADRAVKCRWERGSLRVRQSAIRHHSLPFHGSGRRTCGSLHARSQRLSHHRPIRPTRARVCGPVDEFGSRIGGREAGPSCRSGCAAQPPEAASSCTPPRSRRPGRSCGQIVR